MSRAFSTALKTGTAGTETTLGWLLAITPVGLDPVYLDTIGADFTDTSDSPAKTYLGDPGFVMGNMRVTDGSDPESLAVGIPVSADGPITPNDVVRGLYIGASVVVNMVDYENSLVSPPFGYRWMIGRTRILNDGRATFEIEPDTRVNDELILKPIGVLCPFHVGDSRCGLAMASFTDAVTVASAPSLYELTVTGTARADAYFNNGAIRFDSGGNAGRSCTVRKYTQSTGQVLLWEPVRTPIQIGDTASIHAGCDKLRATCHTKFSHDRHGGFPRLPADDAKFSFEAETTESAPTVVTEPQPLRYQWTTGRYIV